ncbi:MAG: 4Fe-4S dicluster domain-containing protein [Puniceicoccaceae bacterium]|nr:MAG: 4Fe-4S dicluster domain-containing protein [Puniceicoccaceae bacterium]
MTAPNPGAPPPPPVRGEGALVRLDRCFAAIDGWLDRRLPAELNPLSQSGRAANFALLVAVVSGVLMLFWYSPSVQQAYESLAALQGRTLGGWMRALHRHSSDLLMLLLVVHALRTFAARKFAGGRWLPWVSGVATLALIWFIGWTGYWLVWDAPAAQVAVLSVRALDVLPIFGEPIARLFVADRLVPSLLFFVVFFLHLLLPLLIAVGLVLHLARLSRVRLLPGLPLCLLLLAGMAIAALLAPAPLDEPARMTVKPESFVVDAWYLTPLAVALRFQESGLWLSLGLTFGLALSVPWLFRRRNPGPPTKVAAEPAPRSFQTVVNERRCHACTQCFQDCPYDAIRLLPRTDYKPFPVRAWVDPDRCVGCAVCVGSCDSEAMDLIGLPTMATEARIEADLAAADRETPAWMALVAADIDGGMHRFDTAGWARNLPGYRIHPVPTAGWVRPKLVERLLRKGAGGVLIVRDARAESAARDGNQWIEDRLHGSRKPLFRPARAGSDPRWQVVDFRPGEGRRLSRAAEDFRHGRSHAPSHPGRAAGWIAASLLMAVLLAAAVIPGSLHVTNPAAREPELVLAFRAFGDLESTNVAGTIDDDSRPIHMRGRDTAKPRRHPVTVAITIDGATVERSFRARGISRDGPATGELRLPLAPGPRQVSIAVRPGPDADPDLWEGSIQAREGRYHVLTYESGEGFRVE